MSMWYFLWCLCNIRGYIIVGKYMQNKMTHKIKWFYKTSYMMTLYLYQTIHVQRYNYNHGIVYKLHCTTKTMMNNTWTLYFLYHITHFMKHFRMKWPVFLPRRVWWLVFNGNSVCLCTIGLIVIRISTRSTTCAGLMLTMPYVAFIPNGLWPVKNIHFFLSSTLGQCLL